MRPLVAIVVLAVGSAARPALAQQRPVRDPLVRRLAELERPAAEAFAEDTALQRLVAVSRDAFGRPEVHLWVRPGWSGEAPLLAAGAEGVRRLGPFLVARVPLEALDRLLADSSVAGIYAARRLRPINDIGAVQTRVSTLRSLLAPDTYSGPIGRGTIVGLVDTGADFLHRDFRVDSLDRSRILYLWDQTVAGSGPGVVGGVSFDTGLECQRDALTSGACPSHDTEGHGTHVLGTAAGDGTGTGGGVPAGRYAGMAPGADIIVVKTTLMSDDMVDGVNYIFRRAEELGRPAVVNLSLGTQWGPHDGTLAEEIALDSLVGPGRIVVAAAGNEGDNRNTVPASSNDRLHGRATVSAAGQTATFTLAVGSYTPRSGDNNDFIVLSLWYPREDTLTVTVVRPDGSSAGLITGGTALTDEGAQGRIQIENGSGAAVAPGTADNLALIVIGDLGGGLAPQGGATWTVRASAAAARSGRPMHLWLVGWTLPTSVNMVTGAQNGYLVSSPATASRVLAVGAYTTRVAWRTATDTVSYPFPTAAVGDLADFSSPGPRRDEVLKPDLAAPGMGVVSTLSQFASVNPRRVVEDGAHWVLEGTSMATPHVVGVVALLLERDPTLTPERVRTALRAGARTDAFTVHPFTGDADGTPNASWGYGKLDAPGSLATIAQLASVRPGAAHEGIAGRVVPLGEFRVLHLVVIGESDSATVLDSLALSAAGTVNEGAALARLSGYADPDRDGVVEAGATPLDSSALSGDDPRVVLRVGRSLAPGDTLSLVVTARHSTAEVQTGRTVRFDVASAADVHLRTAAGRRVGVIGPPVQGPVVTLQGIGRLTLAMRALPGGELPSSAPGSRVPLLRLVAGASADEPIAVLQLVARVVGQDSGANVRLVQDANGNGVAEPSESVLYSSGVALTADSQTVRLRPASLVVAASDSVRLLVDVLLSGATPNWARFGAALVGDSTRTRGVFSEEPGRLTVVGSAVGDEVVTTLLSDGERINLSANPVRTGSVIFNYSETPRRITIYAFTGARVKEFSAPQAGRQVWDLTTADGRPVANGVYVVVFDFGQERQRRRLFVAR